MLYRTIFQRPYEENFDTEMMAHIELGEIVWDVGANIGFFTQKFAQCVGPQGFVVAFEPSPKTFALLQENTLSLTNVRCENLGLANLEGQVKFSESSSGGDPTNKIMQDDAANTITANVTTGNHYSGAHLIPNAIKIDVEGFEIEVIAGMSKLLLDLNLKKIFVEVHFLEMAKRGFKNGPTEITNAITEAGFRIKWVDQSHFIATR